MNRGHNDCPQNNDQRANTCNRYPYHIDVENADNTYKFICYWLRHHKQLEDFRDEVWADLGNKTVLELYNIETREPSCLLYVA